MKFTRSYRLLGKRAWACLVCVPLLLTGCGSVNPDLPTTGVVEFGTEATATPVESAPSPTNSPVFEIFTEEDWSLDLSVVKDFGSWAVDVVNPDSQWSQELPSALIDAVPEEFERLYLLQFDMWRGDFVPVVVDPAAYVLSGSGNDGLTITLTQDFLNSLISNEREFYYGIGDLSWFDTHQISTTSDMVAKTLTYVFIAKFSYNESMSFDLVITPDERRWHTPTVDVVKSFGTWNDNDPSMIVDSPSSDFLTLVYFGAGFEDGLAANPEDFDLADLNSQTQITLHNDWIKKTFPNNDKVDFIAFFTLGETSVVPLQISK